MQHSKDSDDCLALFMCRLLCRAALVLMTLVQGACGKPRLTTTDERTGDRSRPRSGEPSNGTSRYESVDAYQNEISAPRTSESSPASTRATAHGGEVESTTAIVAVSVQSADGLEGDAQARSELSDNELAQLNQAGAPTASASTLAITTGTGAAQQIAAARTLTVTGQLPRDSPQVRLALLLDDSPSMADNIEKVKVAALNQARSLSAARVPFAIDVLKLSQVNALLYQSPRYSVQVPRRFKQSSVYAVGGLTLDPGALADHIVQQSYWSDVLDVEHFPGLSKSSALAVPDLNFRGFFAVDVNYTYATQFVADREHLILTAAAYLGYTNAARATKFVVVSDEDNISALTLAAPPIAAEVGITQAALAQQIYLPPPATIRFSGAFHENAVPVDPLYEAETHTTCIRDGAMLPTEFPPRTYSWVGAQCRRSDGTSRFVPALTAEAITSSLDYRCRVYGFSCADVIDGVTSTNTGGVGPGCEPDRTTTREEWYSTIPTQMERFLVEPCVPVTTACDVVGFSPYAAGPAPGPALVEAACPAGFALRTFANSFLVHAWVRNDTVQTHAGDLTVTMLRPASVNGGSVRAFDFAIAMPFSNAQAQSFLTGVNPFAYTATDLNHLELTRVADPPLQPLHPSTVDGFLQWAAERYPTHPLQWNGLVNLDGRPCPGDASGDAAKGTSYIALANATGGRVADICEPSFDRFFDELVQGYDIALDLEYEVLDPTRVTRVTRVRDGKVMTAGIEYEIVGGTRVRFLAEDALVLGDVFSLE